MNSVIAETIPTSSIHTRARLVSTVCCTVLVALLVFLFHTQYSHSNYLLSDSADYVRAARSPFLRTYLNTDSASPVRLWQLRSDPEFRVHPWDYLYFHNDNAAIRHFHSPLSFYPLHVVSVFTSADSNQRIVSSLVTAATCGAIVFGLSLFGVPLTVAGLVALVAGIQSRYVEVSVDPSPHGWYMLFAVLFLFTFARYLSTRRIRVLAIAAILLACAFATLEFSLELIASIPVALTIQWLVDRRALGDFRALAISILKAVPIFLGASFVLWPGGWIRGGYLESYGITGATVLLKNKAEFGSHTSPADLYRKFFGGHEALLLLFVFAVLSLIFLAVRRGLSTASIVFMSYTAVAFALGIADHFRLDTYISEALLFFLATAALLFKDSLAAWRSSTRQLSIAAAVIVLIIVGAQEWLKRPPLMLYQPWLKPILAGISSDVPPGSTIVVNDNWEAYHTYLPKYDYEPTTSATDITPRNPERANGAHFFLLTNDVLPMPGITLIQVFPTNLPGRTVNLYAGAR